MLRQFFFQILHHKDSLRCHFVSVTNLLLRDFDNLLVTIRYENKFSRRVSFSDFVSPHRNVSVIVSLTCTPRNLRC